MLPRIINFGPHASNVKVAKLLLQHAQATPGLVGVDELLAEAARVGRPDMCRMLIVDAHADARTVLKSSSGGLEPKENCLEVRPYNFLYSPDEVLEEITACLSGASGHEASSTGN